MARVYRVVCEMDSKTVTSIGKEIEHVEIVIIGSSTNLIEIVYYIWWVKQTVKEEQSKTQDVMA